jgi:hypothetical protein
LNAHGQLIAKPIFTRENRYAIFATENRYATLPRAAEAN